MDIDIPEISIADANEHTKFSELGLGLCTPFRPSEVPNLKKFTYDKVLGKIVQEKVKKLQVTLGNPISVLTQNPIIGNANEDLVTIASVGSNFMNATKDHIRNLCQQNLEKEAMIKELEDKLQQVKIDKHNVQRFKASAKKVRKELEEAIIDMHAQLHMYPGNSRQHH